MTHLAIMNYDLHMCVIDKWYEHAFLMDSCSTCNAYLLLSQNLCNFHYLLGLLLPVGFIKNM